MEEMGVRKTRQGPVVERLRGEKDLTAEERSKLQQARARTTVYRTHFECVVEYLKFCELLVELRLKPAGYQPSVHRLQQELGIGCWRTVKRCLDRALEKGT